MKKVFGIFAIAFLAVLCSGGEDRQCFPQKARTCGRTTSGCRTGTCPAQSDDEYPNHVPPVSISRTRQQLQSASDRVNSSFDRRLRRQKCRIKSRHSQDWR